MIGEHEAFESEIKSTMHHHGLKAVVWQKALVLWMLGDFHVLKGVVSKIPDMRSALDKMEKQKHAIDFLTSKNQVTFILENNEVTA